jgi:hypothetical protein
MAPAATKTAPMQIRLIIAASSIANGVSASTAGARVQVRA